MKMHYSRFGYTTLCGKKLSSSRLLTRMMKDITCKSCARSLGKFNQERHDRFIALDKEFNTSKDSPLHHDNQGCCNA